MKNRLAILFQFIFIITLSSLRANPYPDQHYIISGPDSLLRDAGTVHNIARSADGQCLQLVDSALTGYIILRPQNAEEPFNRGLPSWNGSAPDLSSSFKVQMRFPYGSGWSSWLTVGFWKNNIWSSYGSTSFGDGYVDIDYVKLSRYKSEWQFAVIFERKSLEYPSPTIHLLSFFVSDSRTTDNVDHTALLNDKPAEIFIPTTHLYQIDLDPEIGKSICSPTSVSMILISYGIDVEPVQFARDTRDPYHGIFGVWPRVVQNASEYGVTGYVTRYRSWTQARDVLAQGGRIAMSVGQPLYGGHLMMLAGFDDNGNPIVHDPAKSNGYGYQFNKLDLGKSWFDKGGISYTFFLPDSGTTALAIPVDLSTILPESSRLIRSYPNPFNNTTTIKFHVEKAAKINISIYNINGQKITTLLHEYFETGNYSIPWNGTDHEGNSLGSGIYFAIYKTDSGQTYSTSMHLIK